MLRLMFLACALGLAAAEPASPLPGYRYAWGDEFDGAKLDTDKWSYRTGPRLWSEQRPANVSVVDDLTGLSETLTSLAPGAFKTYTSTYTLQQSDLDSDGGGNRQVENYATADTDQTGPLVD